MNYKDILAVSNLLLYESDFIEFGKAVRKRSVKSAFIIVVTCVAIIYVAAIAIIQDVLRC
jgi:hypothetical protein